MVLGLIGRALFLERLAKRLGIDTTYEPGLTDQLFDEVMSILSKPPASRPPGPPKKRHP